MDPLMRSHFLRDGWSAPALAADVDLGHAMLIDDW